MTQLRTVRLAYNACVLCVCVCVCVCAACWSSVFDLVLAVICCCSSLLHLASYEVSEALILRDLIYTFQGIDGKYIKFDQDQDGFRVDPEVCGGLVGGRMLLLPPIACHCVM